MGIFPFIEKVSFKINKMETILRNFYKFRKFDSLEFENDEKKLDFLKNNISNGRLSVLERFYNSRKIPKNKIFYLTETLEYIGDDISIALLFEKIYRENRRLTLFKRINYLQPHLNKFLEGKQIMKIVAGSHFFAILRKDKKVEIWNRQEPIYYFHFDFKDISASGYYFIGTTMDDLIVNWPESLGYIQINTGEDHNIGLTQEGRLESFEELNNVYYFDKALNIAKIATCGNHTIGLKFDGTLWNFQDDSKFIDITAGGDFWVGLKSDNTIKVWNFLGEENTNVPTDTDIIKVFCGKDDFICLKSNGRVIPDKFEYVFSEIDYKYGIFAGLTIDGFLVYSKNNIISISEKTYSIFCISRWGIIVANGNDFVFF